MKEWKNKKTQKIKLQLKKTLRLQKLRNLHYQKVLASNFIFNN